MKTSVIYFLGLLTGILLMVVLCLTNNMPIKCCSEKSDNGLVKDSIPPDQGVVISRLEFDALSDSFQVHNPGISNDSSQGYWGGKIGKLALKAVLNKLDSNEQFVNYRFGISNHGKIKRTHLMFASGEVDSAGNQAYFFITNSAMSTVFCPPTCIPRPTPKPD